MSRTPRVWRDLAGQGRGDIGHGEYFGHLPGAQRGFGQLTVGSGHEEVCGGVRLDPVLTSQPREELCHWDEALHLGAERQGEAIALSVIEEPLLIRKEAFEGDEGGVVHALTPRKCQEVVEIAAPVFDRRTGVVVHLHPVEVLANLWRKGGHDDFLLFGSRRGAASSPDPATDVYRHKTPHLVKPYDERQGDQEQPLRPHLVQGPSSSRVAVR